MKRSPLPENPICSSIDLCSGKKIVFLISLRILIFFISLFHRQVLRLMQTGVRFIQEIRPYSLNLSDVEHDLWLDSSWTQSIHHKFILFFQQSFQWSEIQRRKLPECESIVPRRTVCLCHNSSRKLFVSQFHFGQLGQIGGSCKKSVDHIWILEKPQSFPFHRLPRWQPPIWISESRRARKAPEQNWYQGRVRINQVILTVERFRALKIRVSFYISSSTSPPPPTLLPLPLTFWETSESG